MTITRKSKAPTDESGTDGSGVPSAPVEAPASPDSGSGLHSVADFVQTMQEESPTPPDEAPPKPVEAQSVDAPTAPASDAITDAFGTVYDPTKHARKADGSPAYQKSGAFRNRRGTGAARSQVNLPPRPPVAAPGTPAALPPLTAEEKRKAAMVARACTDMVIRSCVMLGGDEWYPINKEHQGEKIDERGDMVLATTLYCEEHRYTDVPAGLLVMFAFSCYALPRFGAPQTKKRVQGAAGKVKEWALKFQNWRARRASRTDKRPDGERKIDASAADSKPSQGSGPGGSGT